MHGDSLFIPTVLGDTADVSSPDPETRELIRVTVSPTAVERVEPKDAVVSFPLAGDGDFAGSAQNVMATFCHSVFFFTSLESGQRWRSTHEGTVLGPVDDAFELGQRLVRKQFGLALDRRSAARAGIPRSSA